jgi:hypothetical protein
MGGIQARQAAWDIRKRRPQQAKPSMPPAKKSGGLHAFERLVELALMAVRFVFMNDSALGGFVERRGKFGKAGGGSDCISAFHGGPGFLLGCFEGGGDTGVAGAPNGALLGAFFCGFDVGHDILRIFLKNYGTRGGI